MEEQHPIPQQISAYQFRLVGDMTLKQFFQVAGGALVALLIYASPLHPIIKWPAILVSFLFGVALAFFPIEDRPLDKWIFAFFKSIYSPTVYIWRQAKKKSTFFQPEKAQPTPTEQVVPAKAKLEEVAPSEPEVQITPAATGLEETEKEFLSRVSAQLGEPAFEATAPTTVTPRTMPSGRLTFQPPTFAPTQEPSKEEKRKVYIPKAGPTYVEKKTKEKVPAFERPIPVSTVYMAPTPAIGQKAKGAVAAKFEPEAAPPSPPTKANIIVGQVIDAAGKIVDAAILEIKDDEGRPVRALKTNKLGHFMIVTPLLNGRFEIVTEKEGLEFSPVTFETRGAIIPPIAIRARNEIKDGEPNR